MATNKRVVSVSVKRSKRAPMATREDLEREGWDPSRKPHGPEPELEPATDGLAIVRIDPALIAMIAHEVKVIREAYPGDLWDHDIDWDTPFKVENRVLCYSLGFVAGCAATLDLTPGDLIAHLRL